MITPWRSILILFNKPSNSSSSLNYVYTKHVNKCKENKVLKQNAEININVVYRISNSLNKQWHKILKRARQYHKNRKPPKNGKQKEKKRKGKTQKLKRRTRAHEATSVRKIAKTPVHQTLKTEINNTKTKGTTRKKYKNPEPTRKRRQNLTRSQRMSAITSYNTTYESRRISCCQPRLSEDKSTHACFPQYNTNHHTTNN